MTIVLDASVTLAQAHIVERTPAILEVFEQIKADGAWVPSLWRLEVANVLEMGVRRGRQTAVFRDVALGFLAGLPIEVDPETDFVAWGATLQLAVKHRLTVYDAAYLELRSVSACPLPPWTRSCAKAASLENVPLLGA